MARYRVELDVARRALLLCIAASLFQTASGGNPYFGICERNAFHLRPPPLAPRQTPLASLPKIRLTGITTILPGKRALLKVEFPAKPPEKASEESYILTEGQRAGPIEVLEINEKKEQVKVDNSGTITNLTFEKLIPAKESGPAQFVPRWSSLQYRRPYR
jgi:hypothetical protein